MGCDSGETDCGFGSDATCKAADADVARSKTDVISANFSALLLNHSAKVSSFVETAPASVDTASRSQLSGGRCLPHAPSRDASKYAESAIARRSMGSHFTIRAAPRICFRLSSAGPSSPLAATRSWPRSSSRNRSSIECSGGSGNGSGGIATGSNGGGGGKSTAISGEAGGDCGWVVASGAAGMVAGAGVPPAMATNTGSSCESPSSWPAPTRKRYRA